MKNILDLIEGRGAERLHHFGIAYYFIDFNQGKRGE